MICGDPDQALAAVPALGGSAGADQLSFGLRSGHPTRRRCETIRLIGEHVIPKLDTDPVHRTTRFRQSA